MGDKHKKEGQFQVREWEEENHKGPKRMVSSHKVVCLKHPIVDPCPSSLILEFSLLV